LAVDWLIGISNNKDIDKNVPSRNTDNLKFLRIRTQRSIPGKKYTRQTINATYKIFSTRS
jgi:hypothetical protein